MRRACFTLTVLLAAVPAATAQIPLPPGDRPPISTGIVPVAAPLPAALEAHLKAWEAKSVSIVNMYTECEMVRKNLILRKEATFTGSIVCMKPSLARMKLENKADKADYLAYICDGTSVTSTRAAIKPSRNTRFHRAERTTSATICSSSSCPAK